MPKPVTKLVADIVENLGFEPEVTRVGDRRFRVTISGPRVYCTVDFKFTGNRWEWADSKLSVDNERVPIMPDQPSFYRLFKNPDTFGLEPSDLSILNELAPVPADIAASFGSTLFNIVEYVERRLSVIDPAATVQLLLYRNSPAMLVKLPRSAMLWLTKQGGMYLALFDLDGLDFTERFNKSGKLEEIFAFLAESHGVELPPLPKNAAPPTQFSSNPQNISNSVRVRKQSVIRT